MNDFPMVNTNIVCWLATAVLICLIGACGDSGGVASATQSDHSTASLSMSAQQSAASGSAYSLSPVSEVNKSTPGIAESAAMAASQAARDQ